MDWPDPIPMKLHSVICTWNQGHAIINKEKQTIFWKNIIHSWLVFLAVVLPALCPVECAEAKGGTEDPRVRQHLEKSEDINDKDEVEEEGEEVSVIQKNSGENIRFNGAI